MKTEQKERMIDEQRSVCLFTFSLAFSFVLEMINKYGESVDTPIMMVGGDRIQLLLSDRQYYIFTVYQSDYRSFHNNPK